jgi:6-pyruvoyltetrahydropterin/6-carboxytetrahydropterin synthase
LRRSDLSCLPPVMTIILSKDFEFESAQSLPQFPEGHKCRKVHGHSFKITISVRGPVDEASGIFYDHAVISDAMRPIVEQLDHAYLNDIVGLENPTIELMTRWFWEKLKDQLPGLYEIVLHETPRARCVYRGE